MLGWRHPGFSAHNKVKVPAEDTEGRKKLAGTMLRAPMFLKITYDAITGTVICRSKMHLGSKRNFQAMPGAQWLALLCSTFPIATSTSFATSAGTRTGHAASGQR
jgi:hypothetical protein